MNGLAPGRQSNHRRLTWLWLACGLTSCHLISGIDAVTYGSATSSSSANGGGGAGGSGGAAGAGGSGGAGGAGESASMTTGSGSGGAVGAGGAGGSGEASGAGGSGGAPPMPSCPLGMAYVPADTFTMGDEKNKDKAGKVTVAAFCMDKTEVTVEAYAACVNSNGCIESAEGGFCNRGVAGREKHPVNCVTWPNAEAYCKAYGKRLPTEEEWEYAARGTDGRLFPWGDKDPSDQLLCWNRHGAGKPNSTCPAGSFSEGESPFGIQDLAGNVYEFTSSLLSQNGTQRVGRGGAWGSSMPPLVRSAHRTGYADNASHGDLGFRCAAQPTP